MKMVDEQSLAIAWRNDIFARPTRTRVTPSGKMMRKTILMESEVPEDDPDAGSDAVEKEAAEKLNIPAGISAKTLRELADLEDKRQLGEISEYDYERQRRRILDADPSSSPN
jgi:hypothetical protein